MGRGEHTTEGRGSRRAAQASEGLLLALAFAACCQLACAAPALAFFASNIPSRVAGPPHPALRWAPPAARQARPRGLGFNLCAKEGGRGGGPLGWLRGALFPSPEEIKRSAAERRKAEVQRRRGALPKRYSRTEVQVSQEAPVNASRYVPPEQSPSGRKKADMTWEDRVRYESQRDGNRFRQNTILTETLKRGG